MIIKFPEDGHAGNTRLTDPLPVGTRLVRKKKKKVVELFRNRKKKEGKRPFRNGTERWESMEDVEVRNSDEGAPSDREGRRVGRGRREKERESKKEREREMGGEERCPTTRKFP